MGINNGTKKLILANAKAIIARIHAGEKMSNIERSFGITSHGYIGLCLRRAGYDYELTRGKKKRSEVVKLFIQLNAEQILERLKVETVEAIESEIWGTRRGFLIQTLKALGYNTNVKASTEAENVRANAEKIIAARKAGRKWQDIREEFGIKQQANLRKHLREAGYNIDELLNNTGVKAKKEDPLDEYPTDAQTDGLQEYLLLDFSTEFQQKIGEKRRRAFWDLLQNAAFVSGFISSTQKDRFYHDFLFRSVGKRHFSEVVSPLEFNALYMGAAIIARDAVILERVRSRFVDHLLPKEEEEPQDRRRNDCRGCL